MNLCKDCRHVDKKSLKLAIAKCNRIMEETRSYISEVTGKTIFTSLNQPSCKYERILGSCKNAKFFEPEK